MSRIQRIRTFIEGLIIIIGAILLIIYRSHAYEAILIFLAAGFIFYGVKRLVFYFLMARHMVGGKEILYKGIILFNFGVITSSVSNIPKIYILLYLAVIHAFSGIVEILRTNELKTYGGKAWRMKLFHGIVNIMMAAFCILFFRKQNTAVYIYSVGLIYSGIIRMVTAFRRTTFMFIR